MAIRRRFGTTGVGYAPVGAQLMERRAGRRAAARARREAMEFQAEQADIAREMAAEQAEAARAAATAAATQQQAAALQRTALQVGGAGARQQVGIEAAEDAQYRGTQFKTGQELMKYAIDQNTHSPTQLSRMTKLMADRASVPTDRSLTPEQQATALQAIDGELNQLWQNPAGELKKKEPTFEEDSRTKRYWDPEMKAWVYAGRYGEMKIHEPKAEIAAEAKATAAQAKIMGDLQKDLTKLEAERRAYMKFLEGQTVKVGKTTKRVYDAGTVLRMAAKRFDEDILAKEAEIYAAEEGFGREDPGEGVFPERTPFGAAVERAGVPAPIEAPPEPGLEPPPALASPTPGMGTPATPPPKTEAQFLQEMPPEARQAYEGEQRRMAPPTQAPQDIKRSPKAALDAFRQLTPQVIQTLSPEAQQAYPIVQRWMEAFMAEPATKRILGVQQMPAEIRAMIAVIVAQAQGKTNAGIQ